MVTGRRARNTPGSPHRDRPTRWGASVTGVSPSALRACCIWCRMRTSGTDRRLSEPWLERLSLPDLGSRCTSFQWPSHLRTAPIAINATDRCLQRKPLDNSVLIEGPVNAMPGDRVASQRGWMQGAGRRRRLAACARPATPQTAPLRSNPQGSSPQPAPRRCAPCACRRTHGVARLDGRAAASFATPGIALTGPRQDCQRTG
jgi:hypothetical protein